MLPARSMAYGLPGPAASVVLFLVLWLSSGCEDARVGADCSQWNTKEFFRQAGAAEVRTCLQAGASLEVRNFFGENPIHVAAMHSEEPAVIEALVEAGANPNALAAEGTTPLHAAVDLNENLDIITALAQAGADPNRRDHYGWMPLHVAVVNPHDAPGITKALLRIGADPHARGYYGTTVLHRAARYATHPKAVIRILSRAGVDLDVRTSNGSAPLHWAATYSGGTDAIRALIKAGADPNAQDRMGATALHSAIRFNERPKAVVATLIELGTDPSLRNLTGQTPWEYVQMYDPMENTGSWKALRDGYLQAMGRASDPEPAWGPPN